MSIVLELALMDCKAQVIASIHTMPVDPREVARFVELFRFDFQNALTMGSSELMVWSRDRDRVTTLARAIGAFAEFLAIADTNQPGSVAYDHLLASYRVLGPQCHAEYKAHFIVRQYCANVPFV